jgi:hypothetical protein
MKALCPRNTIIFDVWKSAWYRLEFYMSKAVRGRVQREVWGPPCDAIGVVRHEEWHARGEGPQVSFTPHSPINLSGSG